MILKNWHSNVISICSHIYLKIFFAVPFVFIFQCAYAQIPENNIGLNPASLDWNQINTERVRVVFPKGMESGGVKVASIAERLWESNSSLGKRNRKLDIFLHNQTTTPNGLVTPGPFRSEFYTRSPQFNCTSDWLDLLTIHEYQHVKQFANADQGITGLGRILLGSWTWGGLTATAIPRWFFEGDATVVETQYSQSGRGRLPAFHMEYKALIDADRLPDYEKAGARSYKEYIPDWYRLGYYMSIYAQENKGEEVWNDVFNDAVRFKGLVYPFSSALKRKTGWKTKDLYRETMNSLVDYWKQRKDPQLRTDVPKAEKISTTFNTYTNFTNGHKLQDNRFLMIKSGFDHIPQVISIDESGNEALHTVLGFMPENPYNSISYQNNQICWAENSVDPRWRYKNYSVIKMYDLITKEKKQLTKKSKYFSPELNKDASKIIAVEISPLGQYTIVELDATNGQSIKTYSNPRNATILYPTWDNQRNTIISIVQENETHYLAEVREDGSYSRLTPALPRQLSHPVVYNHNVYFSAAYREVNQVYALDIRDNKIYQVTFSSSGAFMPSISQDGRELIFSEYHSTGHRLMKMPIQPSEWLLFDPDRYDPQYFGQSVLQDKTSMLANELPKDFEVSKFRKSNKLINFHSLLPTIGHPIYELSLLSDNGFGTMRGVISGAYNANEKALSWSGEFTFGGWYPEISGLLLKQNRAATTLEFSVPEDTTLITNFYVEEWDETQGGMGLALPLRFQTGSYFHRFGLGVEGKYLQTDIGSNRDLEENNRDTLRISARQMSAFKALERPLLEDESFYLGEVRLDWSTTRNRAYRHLNPRVGLITSLTYRQTFGAETSSRFFSALTNIYLPGLSQTHSLWFQIGYRSQSVLDHYRFPDRFFYPRGYGAHLSSEFYRGSINYSLPIWYPDFALGSLAFVQRVKMNAFYDAGTLQIGFPFTTDEALHSIGLDLTADIRFFRLLDIDLGMRYSYLFNQDYAPGGTPHQFEFLLINISG